jgi:L-fucose isomerase-like protein
MQTLPKIKIGICNLVQPNLVVRASEELKEIVTEQYTKLIEYIKNHKQCELFIFPSWIDHLNKANECWKEFKKENVDAVILFNGTFNTGEKIAEIIRNLDCAFVLWGIPEQLLLPNNSGNLTGSMVAVMAAGNIFKSLEKQFSFVYGDIIEKETQRRFEIFIRALCAIKYLRNSYIGIIGMRPDGFQTSGYDELLIKKIFGTELMNISLCDIIKKAKELTDSEIEKDMKGYEKLFTIYEKDRKRAKGGSRIFIALKKIIEEKHLQAIATECWPEFQSEDMPVCPAHSRLACEGIATACENDISGALSMLLQYALTEKPVFFADLTHINNENNSIVFWHCGNGPYSLSNLDCKPCIKEIYGLMLVNMTLKSGIVTVCRLNFLNGKYTLHVAKGMAIETKQLINGSHISVRMDCGNMNYINGLLKNGGTHHNAIVYGDIIEECREFAKHTGIEFIVY